LKFQSLKNEFEKNFKKQRNPKPLSPPSPFSFWSASSFYTPARFSFSFFFFLFPAREANSGRRPVPALARCGL
jgi:hypothetical protein